MSDNKVYDVRLTFTEPMLASAPCDKEVYARYIQSNREKAITANPAGVATDDEAATVDVDDMEKASWSVFHQDETGIFLYDYVVRGKLKDAASAVTGKTELPAYKSKIDKWAFVTPRRIYIEDGKGARLLCPDGALERPIREVARL